MRFVESCRHFLDPYFDRYDLHFIHADEENLPDESGLIEKRPTAVTYAKPCVTVLVSNLMESQLNAYIFKMPPSRDCQLLPTLFEMDHYSQRLFNIQWVRGFHPIDYVLRLGTWEQRIQALIQAMEESVADMLNGDFSYWQNVSDWVQSYRKKMGLDQAIEPTE